MLRTFFTRNAAAAICVAAALVAVSALAPDQAGKLPCTITQGPTSLSGIAEASGLTLSRRTPGLLWTHNDSGAPVLFAVDGSGVRGRVQVPNAAVDDWEDVTAAGCGSGDCLYIADIGDNNGTRRSIMIYRLPEPAANDAQTTTAEAFTLTYPDGPHDAEALFIVNDGIYVITKDKTGSVYRVPQLRDGGSMLERVGALGLPRVTDADASRDGNLIAVRTNDELVLYRTPDLVRGGTKPAGTRIPLQALKEPQGEGVAVGPGGVLYLVSEGNSAGRLTTLKCTLPTG